MNANAKSTSVNEDAQGLLSALRNAGLGILYKVAFSLAAITLALSVVFQIIGTMPVPWYFAGMGLIFLLIPFLAWTGAHKSSKLLLLADVNAFILLLSVLFTQAIFVEAFYIPAIGLSILFFSKQHSNLRIVGIFLSAVAFLVHDYISFSQISLSSGTVEIVKWSIILVVFVTTWLIFNSFLSSKEEAEEESKILREEKRHLSRKLSEKRKVNRKLADKNSELADKNAQLSDKTEKLADKKKEVEQSIQQLEEAKKQAEKGGKEKYEFFSNMSQEVRMPLNAIIGMTNRLSQDEPREDQLEQLEILDFSSKTLLALMNDLLVFSKIESGRIEFDEIPFDLQKLLDSVVDSFAFTTENKDIDLSLEVDDDLPETIVGDPNRLTQILNNLVINAVKFTNEGEVGVSVESLDSGDDEITLGLRVLYSANGITKDEQQKIFKTFNDEDEDSVRTFGGLMTTKKMIELQGGKAQIESVDEGDVFIVEMPFSLFSEEDAEAAMQYGNVESLQEATILVAEDNAINQNVIQRFLEEWGVNVIVAADGKQALKEFNDNNVNLILMDLQMPKMDGYEAAKKIRALNHKGKSGVPIIALTAAKFEEVKEEVFGSGMNDFLSKSFDPNELQEKIEQHI